MESLIKKAKQALIPPEHFAYYGDLHEEDGWGRTGLAQHRDSDSLQQSNWQVITEDLLERFPDDVAIESASHFLVGWIEELRVRVIKEEVVEENDGVPREIEEEDITDAFKAVEEWAGRIADYPVADESHYYQIEHEELMEFLADNVGMYWTRNRDDEEEMPDDVVEKVARILFDDKSVSRVEDISDEAMNYAINRVAERILND